MAKAEKKLQPETPPTDPFTRDPYGAYTDESHQPPATHPAGQPEPLLLAEVVPISRNRDHERDRESADPQGTGE